MPGGDPPGDGFVPVPRRRTRGEEGSRRRGAGERCAPAFGRPAGSAPPRPAPRVPGAPRARRVRGGVLRRRRRGGRRRLPGPREVQRARAGGKLQPRGSLPHTAPRPRPRRPAVRGDEHPPHRGGPPRSDRPAPPGGAASARRDHRGGSRAGADPPRILPGDSRAHEHAGRLRLRGGGGGVRPDGGVPGHPRTPPAQGRDRPDRRALSRRRGDLRPRVDVLLATPGNASSPRTSAARAGTAGSASSRAGACTATGGSRKRSSPPATCPFSRTSRTSFPSGSPR